jgi:hypothetical protein
MHEQVSLQLTRCEKHYRLFHVTIMFTNFSGRLEMDPLSIKKKINSIYSHRYAHVSL